MTESSLSIRNLSKRYQLGTIGRHTLVDEIQYMWHKVRGRNPRERMGQVDAVDPSRVEVDASKDNRYFWALKDVSFEVKPGEVVGIVGGNGAGKSTLLKLLTRITEPTAGEVDINGRIASLLEVGTGFHPDLTGRENVYMNGTILGMKKREISAKFDEIVSFSELSQFIDTPVKRYSSGMYVKLAFAVAAHLEPEILLIDEVLAVGDFAFQKKCLGKMEDVARQGRTVLFVSHNMSAVKSLCQRAVLLEHGQKTLEGTSVDVVTHYLQQGAEQLGERVWVEPQLGPGDDKARVTAVRILDKNGEIAHQVDITEPLTLEVCYRVQKAGTELNVSASVHNQDDIHIFSSPSITDSEWYGKPHPKGEYCSRCRIPANFFNQGRFSFTIMLVENGFRTVAMLQRTVSVDMVDTGVATGGYFGGWGGVVRPELIWKTDPV